MSGAPKKLHGKESHNTTLKSLADEGCVSSNISGKLMQPVIYTRHMASRSVSDGRAAKVQRFEQCDVESRSELKDSQDNKDAKLEVRETSVEARKSYTVMKINARVSKTENNIRKESKDQRGLISDLSHSDYKSDIRLEKDDNSASVSHFYQKEPKEHHRGQSYTEPLKDGLDPWCSVQYDSHNMGESAKDILTCQEREALEAHEALVENKLDLKGEEKLKDKERQRKDVKHRYSGERGKEGSEHHSNLQRCDTSDQCKEYVREDRERERSDRGKNDAQKDKERTDGGKDHVKRELSNTNDKDSFRRDRALEGHVRVPEKEGTSLELKRHKELGSRKFVEKDTKDKKRERESDKDAHKHEKHWCHEKETEDGRTRVTERDREVFVYGVQQGRRMARSRGAPQSSNLESHFHTRARENERSQGESEASMITYKVGACMQELLKLWKEFEASLDGKIDEVLQSSPTLEIQIPAEHVTATNRQVRVGQLWGTDIYTNDSDLVAVLMHTGYCRLKASLPPPAIQELRARIRVLPPQNCYYSTLRNNVRSRAWGAGTGCSFRVESCYMVKKGGGNIDLEPSLTLMSAQEPTLAPMPIEQTMTTKAATTNALKHQRFVWEVKIQYNLCNEPWVKYSINIVADRGLEKPFYTSARLKKGEVLYLETHSNRYELCFGGEKAVEHGTMMKSLRTSESGQEKSQNHISHAEPANRNREYDSTTDVFRWSRCKKPLSQKVMLSIGIPLPLEHVEVLLENLDWEDVQWSQTGVWVAGKAYDLVRAHFLSAS